MWQLDDPNALNYRDDVAPAKPKPISADPFSELRYDFIRVIRSFIRSMNSFLIRAKRIG